MLKISASYKEKDLPEFAEKLLNLLQTHNISNILLQADLGAGKTTLAKELARVLGIKEPIQSPTFVIEKEYSLANQPWKKLTHIDAYRLEGESDAFLNLPEKLSNPENLVLIEWPEFLQTKISQSYAKIKITDNPQNQEERFYEVFLFV